MYEDSAVFVKNAIKGYGNKQILNELCMNVERGSIYGLLGASGCGKTTLLSCIVGRKSLESGEIWVLGGKPGEKGSGVPGPRVGYMPQDIALVAEFTIRDCVYYFGRILNMEDRKIEERFVTLSSLLDLPPENRYLKNCSGGQQRRVSFACAMVHSPELLILDEPTVGLDPVLRDKIWDYLVKITQSQKTSVIITTHYIEEARQANKIGLMRGGKLLAEESPARLLALCQSETLEEAFLILSKKQEEGETNTYLERLSREQVDNVDSQRFNGGSTMSVASSVATFEVGYGSRDELTDKSVKPRRKANLNKNRLRALMDKNWKQFYRNITGVIFLLTFPIIQIGCFLLAVGGDIKDIKLGVVNDETMTTLCPGFTSNGTAIPYSFSSCHFNNLSCSFLQHLEHPMIHKVYYSTLPEAIESVKQGKTAGVMYMSENFTEAFEERTEKGKDVEEWTLDHSEIKVYMDMSNRQIGATIKYKLYDLFFNFQQDLVEDCKWNRMLGNQPIRKTFLFGSTDEPYTHFMSCGAVITMCFFLGAMMTSQIIITDRKEGVWDRSIVAGVNSLEITLTHFALQACVVIIQAAEMIIITFGIYGQEYVGSLPLMYLITYLEGVCGMAYGFWVSVISTDHSMANIVVTGGFLPMMLLCGLIWPLEAMPLTLNIISKCLPFTLAIESLRNVVKKGWKLWEFDVFKGIGICVFWILALGTISILLIKKKR